MALSFSKICSSVKYPFMFVLLEDGICYDNDDYGIWGATLFNTRTMEIETAGYGHGSDLYCRPDSVKYSEAIASYPELDLYIRKALVNKWFSNLKYITQACLGSGTTLNLPCTINGGRKANGKTGYLLTKETRINEYLAGKYGSRFARNNSVDIGFVYIPDENAVYEINVDYISIDYDAAATATCDVIKDKILHNLEISTPVLAHLEAYAMSYAYIDSQKLSSNITSMIVANYEAPELELPADVHYVDEEKRQAKLKEKQQKIYESKLPGVIAWAKKVGKNIDDVKLIVNRTMRKYNYLPLGVTEVDFTNIELNN